MNILARYTVGGFLLLAASAAPAAAQSGFALKGHYVYNRAAVDDARSVPAENGFGIGAEIVLPFGIGVGVSGYSSGKVSDFDTETSSVSVLAEANYFLKLPILPVAPYAGVHAGLGRYSRTDLQSSSEPELEDNAAQLGYQAGLRFQPTSLIGVDLQYRRVSESLFREQDSRFSRNQVLLGVTLF